ncbi:MAG: C-terminal binding protein [Actinobacteria bacterium]|nr:C-terminal binding protein [Actinomycetota bacterium]
MAKKKVAVRVPKQAQDQTPEHDWSFELEALEPIADIVEIEADSRAEFIDGVRDADAVMTTWGLRIDSEIIGALQKCVVIGVGSVGVDMVDVAAATAAGIVVTNVPDVFIEEVADHTMMLLLDAARMTSSMARLAATGHWWEGRAVLSARPRLLGQTLGLYGFGNVARCTARRASVFGLRLLAHDPYVSELEITGAGVEPVSFHELLERSDFVSIHAPHNAETEHAFGADVLKRMKPTAVLINTSRGSIIDEQALVTALRDGTIGGAALDVLEQEPPEPDNPLLDMPNVLVTPHVASATTRMRPETRRRVGREVALVLRGRWPLSCVNPSVLPRVQLERWQPYPMNRGPNR